MSNLKTLEHIRKLVEMEFQKREVQKNLKELEARIKILQEEYQKESEKLKEF